MSVSVSENRRMSAICVGKTGCLRFLSFLFLFVFFCQKIGTKAEEGKGFDKNTERKSDGDYSNERIVAVSAGMCRGAAANE